MPDFSVRILSTDNGVEFDSLYAPPGGCVTWDNETDETHQIAVGTTFSTDPILARMSSRPSYIIASDATGTLDYKCITEKHTETGSIVIEQVQQIPPEVSDDEGGE
jgi:plastocyanin